jgi:hypothetical protein
VTERQWRQLALAVSVLAVLLAGWSSTQVFEGLPHLEDEFANLWQAQVMAQGEIRQPSPAEPKSFIIPFVVDFNGQRFGKYPPGWPALLSLAAGVGATAWLNPLLAGLAVWFTFRLGRRWLPPGLALLAASLLALSPMALMLSGSLMSHNLSLLLTLCFSLSWLDLFTPPAEGNVPRWLLAAVAGGSLGLMLLTRPLTAAGIAVPFFLHGVWLLSKRDERWPWLLAVGLLAMALGGLMFLWQYALTGDPGRNLYTLWWDYDRIGFGPEIGTLEGGHSLWQAWVNTRFSLRAGLSDFFGWPFLSWLFLPFGLLALRRKKAAWLLIGLIPSLIGAYAFYWIGSWLLGPRYYYEALPALAIVTAAGVGWLAGWLPSASVARWRRWVTAAVLPVLLLLNLLFYLPLRVGGMHGLYGIDRATLAPLAQMDLEPALIIVHADHWSGYANLLLLEPPFSDKDLVVAWSRGSNPDRRVANLYPDHELYHFYADEPLTLYHSGR